MELTQKPTVALTSRLSKYYILNVNYLFSANLILQISLKKHVYSSLIFAMLGGDISEVR